LDHQTAHNRQTYDAIAALYDARQTDELHGVMVEPFERLCAVLPTGALVADLGCGPGRHLPLLADRGLRVLGVDLSEGMLTAARGRMPGRLVCADLRALPLASAVLEGAWSSYALLHLDDAGLAVALREVARVLAPGGHVALLLASGEGGTEESVPYADEHSRWFHLRSHDRAVELCRRAGLGVLWSDLVPEAKRLPVRLLARRPQ
jgi:SAM-dependent methyltransferase